MQQLRHFPVGIDSAYTKEHEFVQSLKRLACSMILKDKKNVTHFLSLRIQLLSIATKQKSNYTTWGRAGPTKWEKEKLSPLKEKEMFFID